MIFHTKSETYRPNVYTMQEIIAHFSLNVKRISKSTFSEAAIVTVIAYYYTGKRALKIN